MDFRIRNQYIKFNIHYLLNIITFWRYFVPIGAIILEGKLSVIYDRCYIFQDPRIIMIFGNVDYLALGILSIHNVVPIVCSVLARYLHLSLCLVSGFTTSSLHGVGAVSA